jgi:hypothetical protein
MKLRAKEARKFDAIVRGIEQDFGGVDKMSTVQKSLARAFAGGELVFGDFCARILRGETVDLSAFSTAVSSLVRLARQLGTKSVAKDVGPSLSDFLREEANHDD